jgi:phage terminase large subunit-like protein
MSHAPNSAALAAMSASPAIFQSSLRIPSAHGPRLFSDVMASFQAERFAAINPALVAVANGVKPTIGRYWFEATKGASKDSDLAVCLLWLLCFSRRPLAMQVGAADADQADELRKAAKDILRLNEWLAARITIQSWRLVCAATESTCEIISADVAGSHGARPDVLVVNELSHVGKWEFVENLLDNASKVPNGLVVIATNAGFTSSAAYKWRQSFLASDRWLSHVYAQPAPWLDSAEIDEAARRNSRARYLRLWHGVWSSGAGDALDEADLQAAVSDTLGPMTGDERGFAFVGGLDLGIKHDHSALVVLANNPTTQRVRLASVQSWAPDPTSGKVDLDAVENAALAAHRRFALRAICYDPYQAALMAQRLERFGVRMREIPFSGRHLTEMASALLDAFRSRRIDLYPHPRLLSDLGRLSIVEKSYGYRLDATRDADGHADTATALALALPATFEAKPIASDPWSFPSETSNQRLHATTRETGRPVRGPSTLRSRMFGGGPFGW